MPHFFSASANIIFSGIAQAKKVHAFKLNTMTKHLLVSTHTENCKLQSFQRGCNPLSEDILN